MGQPRTRHKRTDVHPFDLRQGPPATSSQRPDSGAKGSSSPRAGTAAGAPPARSPSGDPRAQPTAPCDDAEQHKSAGAANESAPHAGARAEHAHLDSAGRAAISPTGQQATDIGEREARVSEHYCTAHRPRRSVFLDSLSRCCQPINHSGHQLDLPVDGPNRLLLAGAVLLERALGDLCRQIASGSVKQIRVPVRASASQIRPPCASTIVRAMARPRPLPELVRATWSPPR